MYFPVNPVQYKAGPHNIDFLETTLYKKKWVIQKMFFFRMKPVSLRDKQLTDVNKQIFQGGFQDWVKFKKIHDEYCLWFNCSKLQTISYGVR